MFFPKKYKGGVFRAAVIPWLYRVLRYSAPSLREFIICFFISPLLEFFAVDLDQPQQFLPVLVDAIQDELAFYTHDMNGKFIFMSKSAERVFNQCPNHWQTHFFQSALTENHCNDGIRNQGWEGNGDSASEGQVLEVYDRDKNRVMLKVWSVQIYSGGVGIGFSGMVRRLPEMPLQNTELSPDQEADLMKRVESLTPVEFEVIELVVDGHLNKRMAVNLGVAVRTIESRRSRAIAKLQTKSLSDLVQTWIQVRRIRTRQGYQTRNLAQTEKNGIFPGMMESIPTSQLA
jgi:DNA-binding CsgD family transcriptional regulator